MRKSVTLFLLLVACGGASSHAADSRSSASGSGSGGSPRGQQSTALSVAAVVHPGSGLAFISLPESGVAAVRLADGSTVWTSQDADRPLAANEQVLVAQEAAQDGAHEARVVMLRVADGRVDARSDAIPLAEWIVPRPWNNGAVYAFDSDAFMEGEDALFRWWARRSPICGGTPESGCSGSRESSLAAVRIELSSGDVSAAATPATLDPPGDPPAVAALGGQIANLSLPFARTVVGDELVTTTMSDQAGRRVLALARFDAETGEARGSVTLTAEDADESAFSSNVPRFSIDARHVVITRLRMDPRPPLYTRTVHEVETGRAVGSAELGNPPRPYIEDFVVVGDSLVSVDRGGPAYDRDNDARLIAVGIADGAERFALPLRRVHGHSQPPSAAPSMAE